VRDGRDAPLPHGKQPFTSAIGSSGHSIICGMVIERTDGTQHKVAVMPVPLYLAHRNEVSTASDLIAQFGAEASFEAAARADRSRDVGNVVHFCRWRQIERLILLLSTGHAVGTVH